MKSVLVIGLCLVAIASGQATTKASSNDPCDPSKLPKAEPLACCPSYPDFSKAPFVKTCGAKCLSDVTQTDKMCCMSKCFLSETKALNADGIVIGAKVVETLVSMSAAKDKAKYKTFATKVVNDCIALSKNPPKEVNCSAAFFNGCVLRGLLVDCPDLKSDKNCKDLQAFAKACKRYPMVGKDQAKQPPTKQDQAKQAPAKQDQAKQPPAKQDQAKQPPAKQDQAKQAPSNDSCDPSKMPKADPLACCPSYPNFKESKFAKTCAEKCFKDSKDSNKMCCMSYCFLNETKALNADGSINTAKVADAIVSMSAAKDKAKYKTFATKVVNDCIAVAKKVADEKKDKPMNCLSAIFDGCVMRGLFVDCPDLKSDKNCKDLQAFAKACKRYPMMMGHKDGNKPGEKPAAGSTKKPAAAKSVETTHPSQSADGALGKDAPNFRDV